MRAWTPLVFAAPVLLATLFLASGALAGEQACAPSTPACVQTPEVRKQTADAGAAELAERYAPIVYLKNQEEPCDGNGEAFPPVEVELIFDNPGVILRQEPEDAGLSGPAASDIFEKGDAYYLDLPGNPAKPGCTYETDFKALATNASNVAYAHIVTEPGKQGVALQYWFYYYFNDWNNNHESDWEMIQVFFDAATVEEALQLEPDHVGYSQHSGGEHAGWESDKLEREGTHPVVYVAAGSHSNQFEQQNYLGRAEEGAGFGCDDATGPSTRLEMETRLVPETLGGADDDFAWLSYEGRWGERKSSEFNGPTGPNMKSQWTKPITWDETKLRDSNVQVPTGKTAGISPSNAFCGIVAFASQKLLGVVAAAPWIIPVVGVALAGSIFLTVRNTDFGLAAEPLRRRRRFGQILRSALRIYRTNAWLMLGIALAFVPAAFIAAGLQVALSRFAPLQALLDVAGSPRFVEVVIGIAVGAVVFGLAYIVVIAGVVAALREIEGERSVSPLRAYKVVVRQLKDLIGARLRALVIVIGLSITVVGVPWAIKRSVSWLFIEQAVLLDDVESREAGAASTSAVRGDWLRVSAIAALLLGIGLLTSLIMVTPIMLFATQVPLQAVNAISSLIYIVLSPFVAISFTLLYLDGRARTASAERQRT